MNPTTGRTSGRTAYIDGTCGGVVVPRLWKYDACRHNIHADKMRLRRLPKWILFNLPLRLATTKTKRDERKMMNKHHNRHTLWLWVSQRYKPGEWIA